MIDMKKINHERSLQDAKTSNDLAKGAAQATILINGGAATALLAYASSTLKIGASLNPMIALGLVLYALGVFFGALMFMVFSLALEQWMILRFPETGRRYHDAIEAKAGRWWRYTKICFGLGIACFIFASLLVTLGLTSTLQAILLPR
jgi:hypothetical protein